MQRKGPRWEQATCLSYSSSVQVRVCYLCVFLAALRTTCLLLGVRGEARTYRHTSSLHQMRTIMSIPSILTNRRRPLCPKLCEHGFKDWSSPTVHNGHDEQVRGGVQSADHDLCNFATSSREAHHAGA